MSFYFGAHMSSKNIIKSLEEVKDLGGNFIQIFLNNPRSLKRNTGLFLKYETLAPIIKQYCLDNDCKIVVHSSYVLNFASPLEDYFLLLQDELEVCDWLGGIGCVIHMGKSLNMDIDVATENMYNSVKRLINFIKTNKLKSKLILETVAGQGTEMFVTENNSIMNLVNFYNRFTKNEKKYVKICIDTCHIFSAGYDIRTSKQVSKLFDDLIKYDLLDQIALIHFNDSKREYNSHVDRHEAIGYGKIGIKGLSSMLKHALNNNIPCMLETPDDSYTVEIPWIKKLITKYLKS